jgi:hypothetical protein
LAQRPLLATVDVSGPFKVLTRPLTINASETRAASSAAAGEKDGLLAWWKFNETDGVCAADASGGRREGQLKGAVRWVPVEGSPGRALEFDGDTTCLDCEDAAEFDVGDRFTLSMWIRGDAAARKGAQTLISKEGAWQLDHAGNETLNFRLNGPRTKDRRPSLTAKLSLTDSRWHHAVATYDGKRAVLYIDGEVQSSAEASGPIALTTAPLCVGGETDAAGFFKGAMADVRIYRRGLSEDEIKKLYSAGR